MHAAFHQTTPARHHAGVRLPVFLLCVGLAFSSVPAFAQTLDDAPAAAAAPRGPIELSIASMDLAGRTQKAAPVQHNPEPVQPAPQSTWRHTFGSERRAVVQRVRRPAGFSADIVVLSGVTSMAQARQVFPARTYHLVLSRQLLAQAADETNRRPQPGVTGIAIRRDGDLRVTAMEHLTQLASEPSAGKTMSHVAGTAVRLLAAGQSVWVLALDLRPGCPESSGTAPCTATAHKLDILDKWVAARRASGEAVVLAGSFRRPLDGVTLPKTLDTLARVPAASEAPAPCNADTAHSDMLHILAAPGAEPRADLNLRGNMRISDEKDPDSGCVLIGRFVL